MRTFFAKKICPMGHPWGPWGPYIRRTQFLDHMDCKFFQSFGVHMNSLDKSVGPWCEEGIFSGSDHTIAAALQWPRNALSVASSRQSRKAASSKQQQTADWIELRSSDSSGAASPYSCQNGGTSTGSLSTSASSSSSSGASSCSSGSGSYR